MRPGACFAALATVALVACDSPPAQNSPPEDNLINATRTDQAFPSQATGNDIITGDEGPPPSSAGNATAGGQTAGGQAGEQSQNQ